MSEEEDISALVTSIDENDIEIIPSNGSEINDHFDFISDHFAINDTNAINLPVIPNQPTTTTTTITRINRQDSEEYEDETFLERIYGLSEMFPDWLHRLFHNSYPYSKYLGQFLKKSVWFCSSSFLILILPILVQLEFTQVAEMQAAQTRQILLGPSAQIGIGQK